VFQSIGTPAPIALAIPTAIRPDRGYHRARLFIEEDRWPDRDVDPSFVGDSDQLRRVGEPVQERREPRLLGEGDGRLHGLPLGPAAVELDRQAVLRGEGALRVQDLGLKALLRVGGGSRLKILRDFVPQAI